MIIGLATGIQKYKLDRRISGVVGDGSWVEWFPGKYRPDTKQYIPVPSAPEPDPEVA
jgi:hypothetical protein